VLRNSPKLGSRTQAHIFRFSLSVLVLSLILAVSALAQHRFLENGNPIPRGVEAGFFGDSPTRSKLDLSGQWSYAVEDGASGTVRLPAAYDFVGKVSFTRNIDITGDQLDKYEFHFVMLGSNYNTEVIVNGEFVTNHAGGYTSFIAPITPNTFQVGSNNVIKVVTDNHLNARKSIPLRSMVWGWRNYGGILRDVFILCTPKLFIHDVALRVPSVRDSVSATITATAEIHGNLPSAPVSDGKEQLGFSFEVFDKISGLSVGKSSIVPLKKQGNDWKKTTAEIVLNEPKLWSPDSPELYLVKCHLVNGLQQSKEKPSTVIDEYDLNFGIRTVSLSGGNIIVNGKKTTLKGVIWQEDHPTWGSSLPYEEMEKDIVLMKSLGANAVRFGGHPPHPYMLNLCDRYGLFAMVELPMVNVPANVFQQEDFLDLATMNLKEMIVRDRNHASVFAWGIGDQFESANPVSRGPVESLVRTAKELDSRPVYFASRSLQNDVCIDLVDLACYNVSVNDAKVFKRQLQDWKEQHGSKPIIVSRLGVEVEHGNRNGYSDPLSYEAQAKFYIQHFDIIKSLEYDGAFVWSFNDWKGDVPALTVSSRDPWMHNLGLVSGQREKRIAYEAVRSIYRSEKFVALPIGNYSSTAPMIYVLAGLVVLIGVAYFYNASRRFRENLNRSMMNSYNFFADVRDQRIVSVIHSTILGFIVCVALAIVASSILYHFRQSWVLDNLLSYVLVYDNIKESMVYLVWNPLKCIAYFSVLFFLCLLALTGLLLALSPLFKARMYPYHAYVVAMWSTPPMLILVPVGMILFRVMETSMYVVPSFILVAALLLWVFFRLLKGVSIMYEIRATRAYVLGTFSCLAVLGLVYMYYDYTQSTSTYLAFMYDVMMKSQ